MLRTLTQLVKKQQRHMVRSNNYRYQKLSFEIRLTRKNARQNKNHYQQQQYYTVFQNTSTSFCLCCNGLHFKLILIIFGKNIAKGICSSICDIMYKLLIKQY